jgi:sulfite exporter TauE/SafE
MRDMANLTYSFAGMRLLPTVGAMLSSEYAAVFLLGLTGTGHCLGMCGAFALAVGAGSPNRGQLVLRHLAYQMGKATSYLFVGAVLFFAIQSARDALPYLQNTLGVITGLVMIAMGVAYAFELRLPSKVLAWWKGSALCGLATGLRTGSSLFRSVLIGWLNGFLPCGLSMMALLVLVNAGSILNVVIGSYVFGLATLPGLLLLGMAGRQLSVGSRRWMLRVGGVTLILLGVLTLVRGVPGVHDWMHQHLMPASTAAGEHDCCRP